MKLKIVVLSLAALILLTGSGYAAYRFWFEPSPELLDAEGGGELIPGETQILDSLQTAEGITFQLVTYLTTEYRCFDVTAERKGSPAGMTGGCGGIEEKAAGLADKQVETTGCGGLNLLEGHFTTVFGVAGAKVGKVRLSFADGASDLRPVHARFRVWFGIGAPTARIIGENPEARAEVLQRGLGCAKATPA